MKIQRTCGSYNTRTMFKSRMEIYLRAVYMAFSEVMSENEQDAEQVSAQPRSHTPPSRKNCNIWEVYQDQNFSALYSHSLKNETQGNC